MAAHVSRVTRLDGRINEVKIPLQNFRLKEGGGLINEMGVLTRIYGIFIVFGKGKERQNFSFVALSSDSEEL